MTNKALAVLGLVFLFAAISFFQDPGWNGNSRLNLTRAIVEHGSLQVDGYQNAPGWATEDAAFFNGHYYSDKAPGSSFLGVPFYFLLYNLGILLHLQYSSAFIKHFLTVAVLAPAFAFAGISMFRIAVRLGASLRMALITTLAVGLGTMLWPYSVVYYGHVIAAALLIAAFDLLFSARLQPEKMTATRYFSAGLLMGYAFITEYTTALIIAGLIIYAAASMKGRRFRLVSRLAAAAVFGALIPLSAMLAYNTSIYGNPFMLGYAHEASNTFSQGMGAGLMGISRPHRSVLYHITLDPKFGLFWLSPVLLLVFIGYALLVRRRALWAEGLLSVFAIGAMLIMNAGYYLWWGGNGFGPRLIIPALPFFIVPLAVLPTLWEMTTTLLGAIAVGQMLIPLMGLIQPALDFRQRFDSFFIDGHPFNGFSILYNYGLPLIGRQLKAGTPSWTLAVGLGLPFWMTIPLVVLGEAALILLFFRVLRHSQQLPPAPAHEQPAVTGGT